MEAFRKDMSKEHHKSKKGAKVNKKKKEQHSKDEMRKNPKAFGVAKKLRARRGIQRNLDKAHQKEYVPNVNRTEDEVPPPISVVVMGPPGSGKSSLIRSMVKRYTRQNIGEIKGPVTVVSSKFRRITFIECPNDLNAMVDLSKVADLVLLLVDASFGFEMETFEFLNILQVVGFPKVMGVLTHLDKLKNNKSLRKTKKKLKNRFWTEIYQGAKLFYFSGITNGKYPKGEIHNLSLFISRMKFRPLSWRNAHPYMIADRFEDVTHPDILQRNPKADRKITLYGYLRGTHLKPETKIHLAGAGDFHMHSLTCMPDPCPLPSKASEKKHLSEKDIMLYAPMADVGNVMYDKDAMYINIGQVNYTKNEADQGALIDDDGNAVECVEDASTRGVEMVQGLQTLGTGMDDQLQVSTLSLFKNTAPIRAEEVETDDDEEEDSEDDSSSDEDDEEKEDTSSRVLPSERVEEDGSGRTRRRAVFADEEKSAEARKDDSSDASDDESSSDEESSEAEESDIENEIELKEENTNSSDMKWKSNLTERAAQHFLQRQSEQVNLMELVYGKAKSTTLSNQPNEQDDQEDDDDDEDLFRVKRPSNKTNDLTAINRLDCSRLVHGTCDNWSLPDVMESIRHRFVTGQTLPEDGEGAAKDDDGGDDDEDMDGDFEDFETGEVRQGGVTKSNETDAEMRVRLALEKEALQLTTKVKKNREEDGEDDDDDEEEDEEMVEIMAEAKRAQETQAQRNMEEFGNEGEETRLQLEGFRNGLYVRIELENVPFEFVEFYNPCTPLVLGGLNNHESSLGVMRLRLKKHRWHRKVLKTNDPLIFSMGWRRFQSLPLYSIEDPNERHRYLKYTPEHMHCNATIYGPLCPPNTGLLAFQNLSSKVAGFRVSATGVVLELDQKFQVKKKLKLIGSTIKVFKNTAFVQGMFNSELEVAKFEGSSIRTVSGIRGQIKKALRGEKGNFRATFEDKILKSDIIFCKTWVPVEPKRLYNPVFSLLDRSKDGEDSSEWSGAMRTVYQLRKAQQVAIPVNVDSLYKPIVRQVRKFNPLRIPKKLEAGLPFASKPKLDKKRGKGKSTYTTKRAVVMEPEERKKFSVIQELNTIRKEKTKLRKEKRVERNATNLKRKAKEAAVFEPQKREEKIKRYRDAGQEATRRASKAGKDTSIQ